VERIGLINYLQFSDWHHGCREVLGDIPASSPPSGFSEIFNIEENKEIQKHKINF
jgi:hypothetical protein